MKIIIDRSKSQSDNSRIIIQDVGVDINISCSLFYLYVQTVLIGMDVGTSAVFYIEY